MTNDVAVSRSVNPAVKKAVGARAARVQEFDGEVPPLRFSSSPVFGCDPRHASCPGKAIMTAIIDIVGREILDSRGNPTVEVDVVLDDGLERQVGLVLVVVVAAEAVVVDDICSEVARRVGRRRFWGWLR